MKVCSAALAMAIALAMAAGACSSGTVTGGAGGTSSGGTGGSSTGGTMGSGGTGGPSCPNVAACGGSVVGTWNVTSSCLKLGGTLDITGAGLDPRTCNNVAITGSLSVTGTWTANANGT